MVTNSCILRVNRLFDGAFTASRSRTLKCGVNAELREVRRVTTEVSWRLGSGVECDESVSIVPQGFVSVKGMTNVRRDGFAHFSGRLIMTDRNPASPSGGTAIVLLTGSMDLIGRIGSHQVLGERCDESQHFEGWLRASGKGPLEGYELRCVVVGQGELPEGAVNSVPHNRITGTLFLPARAQDS